jgi:nitrate reductase gamma subunit
MTAVPFGFQVHIIAAFALFAFWPFTRLVHAFSAPLGYLTRPYVVYRSRDRRPGLRPSRPGWEGPPTAPDRSTKRSRTHSRD